MEKRNIYYVIYLSVIGFIFYVLNYFTPLLSDDWHYNLIFGTDTPIASLGDVLQSQYTHYMTLNGRFIPHLFIQLFDGIWGKAAFNIVNTVVFVLFLCLLAVNLKPYYPSRYTSTTLALCLMVFLLPAFNNCFLWMSGACNYLWAVTLILAFDLLMRRTTCQKQWLPLLWIFGIVCGWTNEAIVFSFAVVYLIHYIPRYKTLSYSQISLLSGFFIGTAMLVFSPGSINRASGYGSAPRLMSTLMHDTLSSLMHMDNIRILPLLTIAIMVYAIIDKNKAKKFIIDNAAWLCSILLTFCFIVWTRHDSGHSRFGFEFLSLIILMRLIASLRFSRNLLHIINFITIGFLFVIINCSWTNFQEYKRCEAQMQTTQTGIVLTNEKWFPDIVERMIVRFTLANTRKSYNGFISDEWIADHFHKDKIQLIPEALYHDIVAHPEDFDDFDFKKPYPIFCKKAPATAIRKVTYILEPTDFNTLPFYIRPLAHKMAQYTVTSSEANKYATINIRGTQYLLVARHPLFGDRIKDIVIE
ncbi:MAG: DUF6056 family protein [Prevotella sp.]